MYSITVMPVKKLYEIALEADLSNAAALAVSSYGVDEDALSGMCAAMCLDFADTTGSDGLDGKTAAAMAEYIITLPEDLDTLFVCCDMGQSRSPAMAAAIMRYHGLDEDVIWKNPRYEPNLRVYKILSNALGVPPTDDECYHKHCMNEEAFRKAIGRA